MSYLRTPLDELLGTRSRVAVMRTLLAAADELTGRETARMAGINHQAAHDALSTLTAAGLVMQVRRGRAFTYRINRENDLIQRALIGTFAAERQFWPRLQEEIRRRFARLAAAVVVFGSVAKQLEAPGSDLDILLLISSPQGKEALQSRLQRCAGPVRRRFGVTLAGVVYTLDEFRRLVRSGNPLARSIVREGKILAGAIPRRLTRGT
jgi:predicted nucleotidyltransferase